MSTRDEMDEQLFNELRDIDLQITRLPFDELKARYTAVGERLAPQFAAAGHPDLAWDARRLVAENILSAALGARPADECEQLLGDVLALGFTDLDYRAHYITMVCGFFSFRPGHEELINRYLPSLRAELTSALQNEEQAVYRSSLEDCDKIRARLEKHKEPASSTQ